MWNIPEQIDNWSFIYNAVRRAGLLLHGYSTPLPTGALPGCKVGRAEVTHLDAVKQVVHWAKENMELSNLTNIRWIVDDALKFLKREYKGKNISWLMLDPPAYGRGPGGERWILMRVLTKC